MHRAHGQAQQYARALPAAETRPPFLIVTDVGRSLDLYSEFTRSGASYVPFPDPRSHRISLDKLDRDDIRGRLRAIWTDPLSLDPSRRSARVTKAIARDLAELAEALEKAGYGPDSVAAFLMRCLFTMFAEDVGLLPKRSFTGLLEESRKRPEVFMHLVPGLWKTMNHGGFSPEIRADLLRFNGGLFSEQRALPLDKAQIDLLLDASKADWRDVEPVSLARCWSEPSTRSNATSSALTIRRAITSSGWSCRRSSNRCARNGPPCKLPRSLTTGKGNVPPPSRKSPGFSSACPASGFLIPPAAPATSSMSLSNT
ncbi:MAG: type IIL restriction-modification enzyme MmeI [Bryobacterales bacterium]